MAQPAHVLYPHPCMPRPKLHRIYYGERHGHNIYIGGCTTPMHRYCNDPWSLTSLASGLVLVFSPHSHYKGTHCSSNAMLLASRCPLYSSRGRRVPADSVAPCAASMAAHSSRSGEEVGETLISRAMHTLLLSLCILAILYSTAW